MEIDNSSFFGNSFCQQRIIYYEGINNYNIFINNSYFNGNNSCSPLYLKKGLKINIENSIFENTYASERANGGYIHSFLINF